MFVKRCEQLWLKKRYKTIIIIIIIIINIIIIIIPMGSHSARLVWNQVGVTRIFSVNQAEKLSHHVIPVDCCSPRK